MMTEQDVKERKLEFVSQYHVTLCFVSLLDYMQSSPLHIVLVGDL